MSYYSRSQRYAIALLVLLIVGLAVFRSVLRQERQTQQAEQMTQQMEQRDKAFSPKSFDPNTASVKQMLEMGFTKYEAVSIVRYREAVRNFRIREDLLLCYGISDSLYYALEPYIEIGEEFRYEQRKTPSEWRMNDTLKRSRFDSVRKIPPQKREIRLQTFAIDTVGVDFLVSTGLLSPKQSAVLVKWRDMAGIHSFEELRECYTVSDSVARLMQPYVIFSERKQRKSDKSQQNDAQSSSQNPWKKAAEEKIDLNKADSAQLVAVYGIGAKTAHAILDYRKKLGGFHSVEQLAEIKIITESNFEKFFQKFFVKNDGFSKIDVNFATSKQLKGHPYLDDKKIRRLLHKRELKGGWSSAEELIEDKILTEEEAQKLRPYLEFNLPEAF